MGLEAKATTASPNIFAGYEEKKKVYILTY